MKKRLITLTTILISVGALAQGKLAFSVGPTHLIYFTSDTTHLVPADANKIVAGFPLAGSSLYTGPGSTIAALAGGPSFIAGLWAGPSFNSLTLRTTTTIAADASLGGEVVSVLCTFADLPAGTPAYFQVQVYDSRYTSACDSWAHIGGYGGVSQIFQATPQAQVYALMYQTGPPVNSTWAPGTLVPVDYAGFPGYYGAIEVYATLSVYPPHVYSQPQNQTNYWGQRVSFSVNAWGYPAPSYQWIAHGTNLSDNSHISGSATSSLTLNGITSADAGSYQVLVSNCAGTDLSVPATLTVVLIPPAIASIVPQPDGTVTLNLTGTPYSTNRLWVTADLTPPAVWSPVSTNVASSGGTWQVTDMQAVGQTARYYRTTMP